MSSNTDVRPYLCVDDQAFSQLVKITKRRGEESVDPQPDTYILRLGDLLDACDANTSTRGHGELVVLDTFG